MGICTQSRALRVASGSPERRKAFIGLASGLPKRAKLKLPVSSFPEDHTLNDNVISLGHSPGGGHQEITQEQAVVENRR